MSKKPKNSQETPEHALIVVPDGTAETGSFGRSDNSSRRSSSESSVSAPLVWLRLKNFLELKAPKTRETYTGILAEWCRFLKSEPGSDDAARKIISAEDHHAIAYLNWLSKQPGEAPRSSLETSTERAISADAKARWGSKNEGLEHTLSNATIAKKFAALRRLYKVLMAYNLGPAHNPFDTDRVPPPPKNAGRKRPTRMLDFKLVTEIISQPDISTVKGIRDRAILSVLFGGGLRRSEIRKLRISDCRKTPQGTPFLYLRSTKARKDAEQAIPPWASEALEAWIVVRRDQEASESDYLFTGFTGKGGTTPTASQISEISIYRLFVQYCKAAGSTEFVSPHSARATAITKLLADGLPHRLVQEFSRHSSIQMVELYDKRRVGVEDNPGVKLKF